MATGTCVCRRHAYGSSPGASKLAVTPCARAMTSTPHATLSLHGAQYPRRACTGHAQAQPRRDMAAVPRLSSVQLSGCHSCELSALRWPPRAPRCVSLRPRRVTP